MHLHLKVNYGQLLSLATLQHLSGLCYGARTEGGQPPLNPFIKGTKHNIN